MYIPDVCPEENMDALITPWLVIEGACGNQAGRLLTAKVAPYLHGLRSHSPIFHADESGIAIKDRNFSISSYSRLHLLQLDTIFNLCQKTV